ncbi:MAG: hypothetical protein IPJ98_10005 [Bryobacterales bacterium]|nr:hypothetical protein [Bryobacterales bacterium]
MGRTSVSVVLLLGLVVSSAEARGPRQQRLAWEALGEAVEGKNISMVMPDGTEIRGKVLAVEDDGLRMKVSRTSNEAAVAKGERLIARDQVSVVKLHRSGWKWRVILTLVAPVVLVSAIAAAAGDLPEQGAEGGAAIAAGAWGSMAIGYLAGWKLDRQETLIENVR